MERRNFLKSAAAAALAGTAPAAWAQGSPASAQTAQTSLGKEFLTAPSAADPANLPRIQNPGTLRGDMLYRPLGTTGVEVSAIGLGGSHVGKPALSDAQSVQLIHSALDRGINFIDNSWDYNEGRSELLVGKALREGGYRQKAFVMTKLDGRTKSVAQKQIDQSLLRLGVDHIDLLQHHEIIRFDDPDRVFSEDGAMEAVLAAKQAGKVRFIGFTGHKDPHIHLYMLDVAQRHGFHFDTAQMPLNVMDAHYRSFAQLVVPRLVSDGIGVLAMKCFGGGDGIILKTNTATPIECLHYSLSLPTSVVITGIDKPEILDQAFAAVRGFRPLDQQQLATLLAKTQQVAMTGQYELFKTTSHFDTTAKHADWLGEDPPHAKQLAPQNAG
ncbi:MAG TPA: aldo/keto reductase [Acidobacteriaceae bacterium]